MIPAIAFIVLARTDILADHIDAKVSPAVDFFEYANGAWFAKNPIPATESGWGIGNLVRDDLYDRLKKVSEHAAATKAPNGSDDQKVGDFWATALDEQKAEDAGLNPLKPYLAKIDAIQTPGDAAKESLELREIGVDSFFRFNVGQDEKDSDSNVLEISQGGLGLPYRYYFGSEEGTVKVRTAYVKFTGDMLTLAGDTNGTDESSKVMDFETALAKVSRKIEDLRDAEKNYNKMKLSDVQSQLIPSFPLTDELAKHGKTTDTVIVGQPEFLSGCETLLQATPVDVLRAYLKFHVMSSLAPYLNKQAEDLSFDFRGRTMSGQKEDQPRWKRALTAENSAIGFILGRAFVKEYFPPAAKKRYSDLIENFRETFAERIDKLTWMSAETKIRAKSKLAAMRKKVGYPDKWKDYSKLEIGRDSFCDNMIHASQWRFEDNLSKLGKPVDRDDWGFPPQTFNAYYNPSNNEIVMPAAAFAIPGMKDSEIDEALIYGNAGASWIGHEMTHGFDDEGRHFDAKGNLADWWTKSDGDQFEQRAAVMVKQFDGYEPIPGIHISGQATLGENIADYGGLKIGIDAFKKTNTYKSGKKIAGLTPMQRFFLGYTLSWLQEESTPALRRALLSDVHSPAKWRVLGPLSDLPEFYEAFGVKEGDPMWRRSAERPSIW